MGRKAKPGEVTLRVSLKRRYADLLRQSGHGPAKTIRLLLIEHMQRTLADKWIEYHTENEIPADMPVLCVVEQAEQSFMIVCRKDADGRMMLVGADGVDMTTGVRSWRMLPKGSEVGDGDEQQE